MYFRLRILNLLANSYDRMVRSAQESLAKIQEEKLGSSRAIPPTSDVQQKREVFNMVDRDRQRQLSGEEIDRKIRSV